MNKQVINDLFATYTDMNAEVEAVQAEMKAKLDEIAARKSAVVERIATAASQLAGGKEVKKLSRDGKVLTIVSRPMAGKGVRWFLRGMKEPKAVETLDIDG